MTSPSWLQTEAALWKAEEKLRDIFENTAEGIFQTTPEGRFVTANPSIAKMFGYASPEEMLSEIKDVGQSLYAAPERRQAFKRLLASDGSVKDFEAEFRRKDGSRV